MDQLRFYRFRLVFEAVKPLCFPEDGTANLVRGGFGKFLRRVAPPEVYEWLFAPRAFGDGPSGFADPPRPFVLRTSGLDGQTFEPGQPFPIDVHLFEVRKPALPYLRDAFEHWAEARDCRLRRVEQLDLEGRASSSAPLSLPLIAERTHSSFVVHFLTPTELKAEGKIVSRPEFGILFARARDRVASICSLYGEGPPAVDFCNIGKAATEVQMIRCELAWHREVRTSRRTGQTHPLGGFTGLAEYEGSGLGEFLPWLRAAQWTGVGRQTVWGKGEISVVTSCPSC
jgi:hypothetical protein